ncbi:MAG: hypothetical protein AVDCRST_MAG07-343, partial [uncultured Frankineae bacterium]
ESSGGRRGPAAVRGVRPQAGCGGAPVGHGRRTAPAGPHSSAVLVPRGALAATGPVQRRAGSRDLRHPPGDARRAPRPAGPRAGQPTGHRLSREGPAHAAHRGRPSAPARRQRRRPGRRAPHALAAERRRPAPAPQRPRNLHHRPHRRQRPDGM